MVEAADEAPDDAHIARWLRRGGALHTLERRELDERAEHSGRRTDGAARGRKAVIHHLRNDRVRARRRNLERRRRASGAAGAVDEDRRIDLPRKRQRVDALRLARKLEPRAVVGALGDHAESAERSRFGDAREAVMRAIEEAALGQQGRGIELERAALRLLRRAGRLGAAHAAVGIDGDEHVPVAIDELEPFARDARAIGEREWHRHHAQSPHRHALRRSAFGRHRQRRRAAVDGDLDLAARLACDNEEIARERDERTRAAIEARAVEREVAAEEVDAAVAARAHLDARRHFLRGQLREHLAERTGEHERAAEVEEIARRALGEAARARRAAVTPARHLEHEVGSHDRARRDATRVLVPRQERHRRRIGLHLAQLGHARRGVVALAAPGVDDALVHVPAVVRGDERDLDAELACVAHEVAEVGGADLRVERVPVILEPDRHDRPLGRTAVARRLQVDELTREPAPETRDALHEGRIRLAQAVARKAADPAGHAAAGKCAADAGADPQDHPQSGRACLLDEAAQVAVTREVEAVGRRLVDRPRHPRDHGVEAGMAEARKLTGPLVRSHQSRVERGPDNGEPPHARAGAVMEEAQRVVGDCWHVVLLGAPEGISGGRESLGSPKTPCETRGVDSPTFFPRGQKAGHPEAS